MKIEKVFGYASWLNLQLSMRKMNVRQLHHLCDERIPQPRIWKWLRGEGVPKYWEGLLIGERLQAHPDYEILRAVNSDGAEIKGFPQVYFPGMGPRKKRP